MIKNYTNKIFNEDCIEGIKRIPDGSIDLICTDPPYSLGKDYGNDSDRKSPKNIWIGHIIGLM